MSGFDLHAAARAAEHQATLAKPPGALGRLEELGAFYAGARGAFPVTPPSHAALPVFVADHGVAAEGVSTHGSEVSALVAGAVLTGGAAVSVLARIHNVRVAVVDVGLAHPVPAAARLRARESSPEEAFAAPGTSYVAAPLRKGTGNLLHGAAMTRDEATAAMAVGERMARAAVASGAEVLLAGEIGIGNTTAAACLVAVLTGAPVEETVGRGTGLDDVGLERKRGVARAALTRARVRDGVERSDPLGVLAALGGLELAAMAGLAIEGARLRVPVILDGYLAGAAALVACGVAPETKSFLLASHASAEPGHKLALDALGLRPLLDLGMRLGEGTGAILGWHLLRTAVELQSGMATLASLI